MEFKKHIVLFISFCILFTSHFAKTCLAGTYWVHPSGTAGWTSCAGATDPGEGNYCSLNTANTNAQAGDKVLMKGGTYASTRGWGVINPVYSGGQGKIILFQAAPGENAKIVAPSGYRGLLIEAKTYIKVSNIDFTGSSLFFHLGQGANFNEISDCTFAQASGGYSQGIISCWNTGSSTCTPSNNNWIHHNVFTKYGVVSNCDDKGTIRISAGQSFGKLDTSHNNTIENNIFSYGGHDAFDLGGHYNIIRNNVFHNEGAYFKDSEKNCPNKPEGGYFGNRNIIVTDYGEGSTDQNLIENNRLGFAGAPPDDDGSMGIENAGSRTIVRYNDIYGNGASGYYSKQQNTSHANFARVYNNTIYANGFGEANIYGDLHKSGIKVSIVDGTPLYTVFKNNIVYANKIETNWGSSPPSNITYTNNFNSDPLFVNPAITDKTSLILPNLQLQSLSKAINTGAPLTIATNSGDNSTILGLRDALYFQDGTWGSALAGHQADWIAIGTVDNVVQISSISYDTNTITLASPITWINGAPIWLYKKSDGEQVLYSTAPDCGAHEFNDDVKLRPKNIKAYIPQPN